MAVNRVEQTVFGVQVWASTKASQTTCPACHRPAARVHGRYVRRLADTAMAGRRLVIRLRVRRFFCDEQDCKTRTFVERVPGLTCRYARRSPLLRATLEGIGLALAGRAGARLARCLGVLVSRNTVLRLLQALPDPKVSEVTVLGVDDFALRRGRVWDRADRHGHAPPDRSATRS